MFFTYICQCAWLWRVDGRNEIIGRSYGDVIGGHVWDTCLVWKKMNGVSDCLRFGLVGEDLVAPVVFRCVSDVPTIEAMWSP